MTAKRTRRPRLFGTASYLLLLVVLLIFLFPFVWTVSEALKPETDVFGLPPQLITPEQTFENFSTAWNFFPFGQDIVNSLLVAGLGTLLVLATSAPAAYASARTSFRGREMLRSTCSACLLVDTLHGSERVY